MNLSQRLFHGGETLARMLILNGLLKSLRFSVRAQVSVNSVMQLDGCMTESVPTEREQVAVRLAFVSISR